MVMLYTLVRVETVDDNLPHASNIALFKYLALTLRRLLKQTGKLPGNHAWF